MRDLYLNLWPFHANPLWLHYLHLRAVTMWNGFPAMVLYFMVHRQNMFFGGGNPNPKIAISIALELFLFAACRLFLQESRLVMGRTLLQQGIGLDEDPALSCTFRWAKRVCPNMWGVRVINQQHWCVQTDSLGRETIICVVQRWRNLSQWPWSWGI